jgi:hypothetical protein
MPDVLETLKELRHGTFAAELEHELALLVDAVTHAAKAGKLTITLTIAPASKGNAETLLIHDTIAVKAPSLERGGTIMFPTAAGALSRRDPRQPELDGIREAPPAAAGPLREAPRRAPIAVGGAGGE